MGVFDNLAPPITIQSATIEPPKSSVFDSIAPATSINTVGAPAPREASGFIENAKAGFQGSALGLAWRGKLPDLISNPDHADWWERATTGLAAVGSDLPLMIAGSMAGAPAGAAAGTAVAGPAGGAIGTVLGGGAGMFAVPAAIRESLIQAYKSGEVMTATDYWNAIKEVAATTAKEAMVGAATMGAGGVAARGLGAAIAPAIGQSIAIPTATKLIGAADTAAQIATMTTMPKALEGKLPDARDFMDAAIVIGGLHVANITAARLTNTYLRTGKTPAEQVADARANPEIAKDLVKPPEVDTPEVGNYRAAEVLKIQENLFRETDRLAELEAKAAGTPELGPDGQPLPPAERRLPEYLTDAEKAELPALRARVAELEATLKTAQEAPAEPAGPLAYTSDQLTEARTQADAKLAELTTTAETEPLTDLERAQRTFLANNLENPELLARHFRLEPVDSRETSVKVSREEFDASAKQVYDDALAQIKDAYEARAAAGLPVPQNAEAAATILAAQARAFAEMHGRLPMEMWQERGIRVRDAAQEAEAAAEAAIPPEAPRFVPPEPEVDLFGEPIVVASTAPRRATENLATQEIPLANLVLSKEVPQFKNAANQEGVVVPLGGQFDRTGVGPIQVWERNDGTLEVISGRHRLDLARRSGEETIPAQIHKESEGFTADQAAMLDAELNIREEQGSVADYAQYFKAAGLTKEAADARGLLARAKGRTGYAIARDGSPDLLAAHRAGILSNEAALSISAAAPASERLQALGIQMVNDGKSILMAVNTMRAVDVMAAERMAAGQQGDIFGFDDSAMKEAAAMAKRASSKQRQISEQISAVSGASRRPELARKLGVNVEDPEGVQKKITELKQEQYLWDNWPLYPELVAKLRNESLKQGALTVRDPGKELERMGLSPTKRQPNTLYVAAADWSGHTRKETIGSIPLEGDPLAALERFKQENPDLIPQIIIATDAKANISKVLSPNGKMTDYGTPEAAYAMGDVDAFRKDAMARIEQGRAAGDPAMINAAADERIAAVQKDIADIQKGIDSNLADFQAERKKQKAGMTIKEHDARYDSWKEYFKNAQRILDYQGANLKEAQDELRLWERQKVRAVDQPAMLTGPEEFDLKAETPAEARARDMEATAAAKRKLAQEAIADKQGKPFTVDQVDMFNTQGTLFQGGKDTYEEIPKELPPGTKLYHGTQSKIDQLNGIVYLSTDPREAAVYARGEIPGTVRGQRGAAQVFEATTEGRLQVKNIDELVQDEIMNDGNLDQLIKAELKKAKQEGYGAISFQHPSGRHGGMFAAIVPTHPNELSVATKAQDATTLYQSKQEPTWYRSALKDAIDTANIKSAPAKGWLDHLKGQIAKGGVKADEIKWSGLEEWLQLQEGKVTKEQVQDYLKANGVRVEEVRLGEDAASKEAEIDALIKEYDAKLQAWGLPGWSADELLASQELKLTREQAGYLSNFQTRWDAAENRDRHSDTKFTQYQLPGGQNYRELLLTLPKKEVVSTNDGLPDGFRVEPMAGGRWTLVGPTGSGNVLQFLNPNAPRTAAIAEAKRVLHAEVRDTANFNSSHFDTPNILAHVRFNERTDAEGKKVLFIEEFQSDWAQKGKKEGFANEEKFQALIKERNQLGNSQAETARYNQIAAELGDMQRRGMGVPAAPFVGKTDAWVALAMKRMISYAAQNGFEKIAWTSGKQQVERYTSALRREVDAIEWTKTKEGVQLVGYKGTDKPRRQYQVVGRNPRVYMTFDTSADAQTMIDGYDATTRALLRIKPVDYTPSRHKVVDTTEKETALSDAIGKAMADKIISDPNQHGTIEGDNITIDSTGMAGFYDKIVPSVANDVLKKLGGGKVSETNFGTARERQQGWRIEENNGLFDVVAPDGTLAETVMGRRTAERAMENFAHGETVASSEFAQGPTKQQSFDITPAMREKASAGLPLFQRQAQDPHRGSYEVASRIATLFEQADESTLLHEIGHHFLENLKYYANQPNAPKRVLDMWKTAREEFAIGEDGEISVASHELNARTFERYLAEGTAPSARLAAVFAQFKQWLIGIYQNLNNIGHEINPEIRSLFDRMLATDQEIADAKEMGIPRAYVPEARAAEAAKIVPPPGPKKLPAPGFIDEQLAIEPFAEELEIGPGSGPTMDSRVNAQYINGPMDLKLAIQQVANRDQANIQARRGGPGGVKSWEQANAEADALIEETMGGKMVADAAGTSTVPHDIQQRAAFKVMISVAKYSLGLRDKILEKGHDATVQDQFDYLNSIVRMRMVHAEFLGLRAAAARAMNQIRDMTPESGIVDKMVEATAATGQTLFQTAKTEAQRVAEIKTKLERIMAEHFGGKTALDVAKLQSDVKDLRSNLTFAKKFLQAMDWKSATGKQRWDMVVEGWKAGLLSGPVTHTTNLFGTGAFQVMRAPVDFLAAVIGTARGASPGMGESDRASMSEAVARLTGMLGGVQDGLKVAWHEFKQDEATGKTESYGEAIPDKYGGQYIRIPLRLMGAEDAMVTTMYHRGEMRTLAIRQAFDEGMNPSTREFATRVDQLMDNPTPAMQEAADGAATRMTFNAPLGEKGVALQLFVVKWNLQWMIPFIRTPINIAKELLRMSPFAPAVGEWRAAIRKGGVERDRALAEIAVGTGIMATTMAYAFSGNISGAGSPDPGKNRGKAGVWQPYSILIGDKWYEYSRIQPTGTLMGMAADVANVWDHMTDEEKDKVPKMLATAFANAITNQTFLQGITNVVNAMSDPTRYLSRFLQQMAGSAVPNVIGQPTTMADPVVREVNGMLEAIQARIPGMRQDLLPKRDWLGEPVQTKERLGVVMPSREQQVSTDKVRLEAARLDISMAAPPKKLHIGKGTGKLGDVELTPQEQDTFERVAGEFAHPILAAIVNDPAYDQIPGKNKGAMIKRQMFAKVLHAAHVLAAQAALPPEKRQAYMETITEKVTQELSLPAQ